MKVTIAIPAYNVANHITNVVERALKQDIDEILIVDDCSKDNTYGVISKLSEDNEKIKIVRHDKNKGYGGAQKTLYEEGLKNEADIIVLLHSDGQHMPEELPLLLAPLKNKEADVVVGSRALGNMLKGGMPLYKYIGNKALTFLENLSFGTKLTGFHDGYKACSKESFEKVNYKGLTEAYHYDSEFLLESARNKLRIKEVPITTVYNESFSGVNVINYSLEIVKLMIAYQFRRLFRKKNVG
tara:strand:+ start:270 stop:992 length:723 start_codon:yes stop_codon:yes gene_type:complete